MKKILLTAVAVFTAISVYGQYEYKINKRTGRFDMVVDTAWVRTNVGAAGPDSTEAGYGLDETANVISVDTSVIDFRARVDSLFENLTIGANTTTTATNLIVEKNDSLHTMSSDYLTVNGGEAVASKLDIVDSIQAYLDDAVEAVALADSSGTGAGSYVTGYDHSVDLATKADYDSPTFTGAVYVPTAAATDTSTHAANTAWVKRHLRTRYEIDSLVISGSNIIAYEGGDTLSIYVPYANRTNAARYDAADTTGVTPDFIGQIYTNTTDSTSYVAVGLTSGGWKKITFEWIWALFIIGQITRKDEV